MASNPVTTVGENVSYTLEGEDLVIRVKTDHRGALSPSGKTIRVGSTLGNVSVVGTPLVVGLNVYVKP